MIHKEKDGLSWHEFELLADCPIIHGCFTRHGGQSSGILSSLNLGCTVGDLEENVETNRNKVSQVLGLPHLMSAKLCHGADVTSLDNPLIDDTPLSDGISTKKTHIALMVTQADCQAAIFYDPINHALANVHSGWRGSVQNIYGAAVTHMKAVYGSKPEDLLVCVSPSLGPESSQFLNYKTELPESFWDFQVKPLYFDFWSISEEQLRIAGVLPHHMQVARIDTYANDNDYFSYRRSNKCGRQATLCALK